MKRLLLALLLAPILAAAQCMPSDANGAGTPVVVELNDTGAAVAWWCPALVEPKLTLYAVRWSAVTPQLRSELAAVSVATDKAAAIQRMRASINTPLAELLDVWAPAIEQIQMSRPPIARWAVARNGAYQTRPAYPVTAGVRGTTSTARATVGAACDMSTSFVEGSSTYGGVGPTLVALCSRVP